MCSRVSQDKLSKTVNMRAMNMLGKAEERYNDLLKKKDIVANDKTKIVKLIEELDQKKNTTLREAHERVNKVICMSSSLVMGNQRTQAHYS